MKVAWLVYFENSPAEKGNISYEELSYIERDLEQTPDKAKVNLKEIPWLKIWTYPPFIVVVLTGFFASVIDFVIMDMMPQYLKFVQFWLLRLKNQFLLPPLFAEPKGNVCDCQELSKSSENIPQQLKEALQIAAKLHDGAKIFPMSQRQANLAY